jgi:lysozyme
MKHPLKPSIAIALVLMATVSACGHKPHVQLPSSALPPSVLQSYSLDDLLIYHEGLRLKPYTDMSNRLTIGIGRNLEDSGITKEEALIMLHNDIKRVSSELDQYLPWWRKLSDARKKVLISMAFNLGIGGLLGFNNMLASLREGDYVSAAEEMLASRWANQVGTRAIELAYMMEKG